MSSKDLPHDFVLEILVCLPVKSLFRFRCVSKLWYSSITNRNFIDAHLKKANLLCNKNGYFVYKHAKYFHGVTEFHGLTKLCMVSCNSDNTVTEVSRYGFLCNPHSSILGVCNGVLPFDGYEPRFTAFGFAYDSQNNDYKIIRIKSNIDYFSYEGVPLIEAAVYTLSSNSWRKLKQPITGKSSSLSISYMAGTNPVFFNGALHWIASSDNDNRVVYPFIVAFDVNDEKFRLIMLPPNASIDSFLLSDAYLVDYEGIAGFDHISCRLQGIAVFHWC
uniref:F-box domain-containing protein n=1 Tax=Fagus sylvatica TaxID=28930 RepID=A0A2N9H0N7_FAGSY